MIYMKTKTAQQFFVKFSDIKLNENSTSGLRVSCVQTWTKGLNEINVSSVALATCQRHADKPQSGLDNQRTDNREKMFYIIPTSTFLDRQINVRQLFLSCAATYGRR
jgi:hypothetical protein